MTPTTELATIPLAAGAASSIEDPTSPAGKVWADTVSTVSQQDGFQRAYWGREVENPSVLQFFVDWTSLTHHKLFIASPTYAPFCTHLATIVSGSISMLHATFTPHPPSSSSSSAALGAPHTPVTEVLTCYFESDENGSKADGFESRFDKFIASISGGGFKGAARGWVVEEVEYKGEKRRAFVGLVGWESVEAHMAFRETEAFRENIPLLRQEALGMELHHTRFDQR